MKILHSRNKVVIKPDEDYTESEGFRLNTEFDPHLHFATTGTVEYLPDKLVCDVARYKELNAKKPMTTRIGRELQSINYRQLPFMPHGIEAKIGDKVLFNFSNQIDRELNPIEHKLIMSYTELIAVLDEDNNPTPINGLVFIEPLSDDTEQCGFIRFQSEHPNKGYFTDRPYREVTDLKIGQRVYFKKGFYRLLSHNLHRIVNFDGTLFAVQRRDILI